MLKFKINENAVGSAYLDRLGRGFLIQLAEKIQNCVFEKKVKVFSLRRNPT